MPIFIIFLIQFYLTPSVLFPVRFEEWHSRRHAGQTSLWILHLLFCDSEERIITISMKLSTFWHAFCP